MSSDPPSVPIPTRREIDTVLTGALRDLELLRARLFALRRSLPLGDGSCPQTSSDPFYELAGYLDSLILGQLQTGIQILEKALFEGHQDWPGPSSD